MTVTPSEVDYGLPTNVDTTSPLVNPSHSELHNNTNRATLDLHSRVSQLELVLAGLTAPEGSIEQARLVANTWSVIGNLNNLASSHTILMPLVWNITQRVVTFKGAKVSVLTPADADIEVDIVVGATLVGPTYDSGSQGSILAAGELVIPAGQHTSVTLTESDFAGQHPVNTYVTAYVRQAGSSNAPGNDLTIQLNRNL